MKLRHLRNQWDKRLTRFGVWWMEIRGVMEHPRQERRLPWITRAAFFLADKVSLFDEKY